MKNHFSNNFTDLLNGLMNKSPKKRLTLDCIKAHPFFKNINWDQMKMGNYGKPPFNP